MITADGCWADIRPGAASSRSRPAVFLDRDGVLIEDTGYPHRAAEVVPIAQTFALVRAAAARGFAVCVVTNQSGIGRGLFGWSEFEAVQRVIDATAAATQGRIDAVFACPHHPEATVPALRASHPWRKPAPGMIEAAAAALTLDLDGSVFVGDRVSDVVAADAGHVGRRILLGTSRQRHARYECVRRDDLPALLAETASGPGPMNTAYRAEGRGAVRLKGWT